MDETRRGFLQKMMAATAAAFAAAELGDPDALLWTPRQKTIIDLGARPALEVPTLSDMASVFMDPTAGGLVPHSSLEPIYMPDRFTFKTGSGKSMTFDSDFRPMAMNGRKLTPQEQAQLAADIVRNRKAFQGAFLLGRNSPPLKGKV